MANYFEIICYSCKKNTHTPNYVTGTPKLMVMDGKIICPKCGSVLDGEVR